MGKINYWRVSSLVLAALVLAMAGGLLPRPHRGDAYSAGFPAPLDATGAAEDLGGERPYRVSLAPDWPAVELPGAPVPDLELKHDYDFGRDWHNRHAANWTKALERFRGKPDVHYLEIGLFEGASFFWVLESILTHPTSRATGIDPFIRIYSNTRNYGDTFMDNLRLSGEEQRSTIITGFSQLEMRKLPLEAYDIIYIDGSHQAADVLEDAILAWRLLKDDGILIFDDYQLWWDRPPPDRPRVAIDVFYTFLRPHFEVTHFGYQVMLTKKRSG